MNKIITFITIALASIGIMSAQNPPAFIEVAPVYSLTNNVQKNGDGKYTEHQYGISLTVGSQVSTHQQLTFTTGYLTADTVKRGQAIDVNLLSFGSISQEQRLNTTTIPVLFGYSLSGNISKKIGFVVGPTVGFLARQYEYENVSGIYSKTNISFAWGLNAGLNYAVTDTVYAGIGVNYLKNHWERLVPDNTSNRYYLKSNVLLAKVSIGKKW